MIVTRAHRRPTVQLPCRLLRDAVHNDRGATAVEYGLIVFLITFVISASVAAVGQEAANLFRIPCGALGPC